MKNCMNANEQILFLNEAFAPGGGCLCGGEQTLSGGHGKGRY